MAGITAIDIITIIIIIIIIIISTGSEAQTIGMGLETEGEIIAAKNIRRPEAMGQEVAKIPAG
jgi:hypothetical protein